MGGTLTHKVEAVAEAEVPLDECETPRREHTREIENVVEHGDTWRLVMGVVWSQVGGHTSLWKQT